jgi:pimeloyl-ACP methyl ester carboxylesterase
MPMYPIHFASPRGFRQAFHLERANGGGDTAMLCVHGWPETKRLYHRVINPLRDAGFDVVAPDLRDLVIPKLARMASTTWFRTLSTFTHWFAITWDTTR